MNRSTTTLLTVIQRLMKAVSEAFGRADTQRVIRRGWRANTFGGTALRSALRGLTPYSRRLVISFAMAANFVLAQQPGSVAPLVA